MVFTKETRSSPNLLEVDPMARSEEAGKHAHQDGTFFFCTSCSFRVAFCCCCFKELFFSSFFFFPKQLRGSHPSTLESRCCTGDVYTGSAS